MYHVYILKSRKHRRTYVGYSRNAHKRLVEHNRGKVKATRSFRPWTILFTEKCNTLTEAKKRELYWKSGAGRRKLKEYFKDNGFPPRP